MGKLKTSLKGEVSQDHVHRNEYKKSQFGFAEVVWVNRALMIGFHFSLI